MPITRSRAAALPSCAGRKRKAEEINPPAKKARKARTSKTADETYLQQAIEEFGKQHGDYPARSNRRQVLETSLRYFRRFKMPGKDDAHFLQDVEAARRLLASDEAIRLPVFVGGSANWSMFDSESKRRPIEQIFDFVHNPGEGNEYSHESTTQESQRKMMTMQDLRRLFVEKNRKAPKYPRNLPDLPNPMFDHGTPHFLQNEKCTLLHDIIRLQLVREPEEICYCDESSDAGTQTCSHRITHREFTLQHDWNYWHGTVMLAEPGSITYPHWDKYSTGIWISCLEGEIAFGWLSKPNAKEKTGWLKDLEKPQGRWLFRVLRPGETLYMPPGTVHYVFRRPGGGQAMGFAGQVLRRGDTMSWLKHLNIELKMAADDGIENAPYVSIVPPLIDGLLHIINGALRDDRADKFGGKKHIGHRRYGTLTRSDRQAGREAQGLGRHELFISSATGCYDIFSLTYSDFRSVTVAYKSCAVFISRGFSATSLRSEPMMKPASIETPEGFLVTEAQFHRSQTRHGSSALARCKVTDKAPLDSPRAFVKVTNRCRISMQINSARYGSMHLAHLKPSFALSPSVLRMKVLQL